MVKKNHGKNAAVISVHHQSDNYALYEVIASWGGVIASCGLSIMLFFERLKATFEISLRIKDDHLYAASSPKTTQLKWALKISGR